MARFELPFGLDEATAQRLMDEAEAEARAASGQRYPLAVDVLSRYYGKVSEFLAASRAVH